MTNLAFHRLLDAYCHAKVDFELCRMISYDKKLHRLEVIEKKLMDVYYSSTYRNNKLSLKQIGRILKKCENNY